MSIRVKATAVTQAKASLIPDITASGPVNIATRLREMAQIQPHALAVACPAGRDRAGRARHTHWTFRQLDRESDAAARGLERHGIGRGVRTVLMVRPGLEFFALTFALFKAGAVPVLIDPGMGGKSLGRCLTEAEPVRSIAVTGAQIAPKLFGWAKRTLKAVVTADDEGSTWAFVNGPPRGPL